MEPEHGIKAVFFDLDGVLVDAADWHRDAFNQALHEVAGFSLSNREHLLHFNGLSTRRKLNMLNDQGRIRECEILLIHELKQVYTLETIHDKCAPVQRVIDTVLAAKQEVGPVAVVTNCSRPSCELMLDKSGLLDLFDFIITNEDVDGKIKPHPWPYLMAAQRLGLNRGESLAIDDTTKGIKSALEAGCRLWHLKQFEDLTPNHLDIVLDRLRIKI